MLGIFTFAFVRLVDFFFSKAPYIAFKLRILLVTSFPGNKSLPGCKF